jgi:hypothetical protein
MADDPLRIDFELNDNASAPLAAAAQSIAGNIETVTRQFLAGTISAEQFSSIVKEVSASAESSNAGLRNMGTAVAEIDKQLQLAKESQQKFREGSIEAAALYGSVEKGTTPGWQKASAAADLEVANLTKAKAAAQQMYNAELARTRALAAGAISADSELGASAAAAAEGANSLRMALSEQGQAAAALAGSTVANSAEVQAAGLAYAQAGRDVALLTKELRTVEGAMAQAGISEAQRQELSNRYLALSRQKVIAENQEAQALERLTPLMNAAITTETARAAAAERMAAARAEALQLESAEAEGMGMVGLEAGAPIAAAAAVAAPASTETAISATRAKEALDQCNISLRTMQAELARLRAAEMETGLSAAQLAERQQQTNVAQEAANAKMRESIVLAGEYASALREVPAAAPTAQVAGAPAATAEATQANQLLGMSEREVAEAAGYEVAALGELVRMAIDLNLNSRTAAEGLEQLGAQTASAKATASELAMIESQAATAIRKRAAASVEAGTAADAEGAATAESTAATKASTSALEAKAVALAQALNLETAYAAGIADLVVEMQAEGKSADATQSMLVNLGFTAKQAAQALEVLGVVSKTTAASQDNLAGSVARTNLELTEQAGKVDKVTGAFAYSTGRIGAVELGVGQLGFAFARLGAVIPGLAQIMAAAFPVVAAIAFIDIVESGIKKMQEWKDQALKSAEEEAKWERTIEKTTEALDKANERLTSGISGIAGMSEEMAHIGDKVTDVTSEFVEFNKRIADGPGLWKDFTTEAGIVGTYWWNALNTGAQDSAVSLQEFSREVAASVHNVGDLQGAVDQLGDRLKYLHGLRAEEAVPQWGQVSPQVFEYDRQIKEVFEMRLAVENMLEAAGLERLTIQQSIAAKLYADQERADMAELRLEEAHANRLKDLHLSTLEEQHEATTRAIREEARIKEDALDREEGLLEQRQSAELTAAATKAAEKAAALPPSMGVPNALGLAAGPEVAPSTPPSTDAKIAAAVAAYKAEHAEPAPPLTPYQEGGSVPETGPALLHEGEYVLTKEQVASAAKDTAKGPGMLERLKEAVMAPAHMTPVEQQQMIETGTTPQREGEAQYDRAFGPYASIYKASDYLSKNVLQPFREGLDTIGGQLIEHGLRTHTPITAAVGGMMQMAPVGNTPAETALMLAMGMEGKEVEGALKISTDSMGIRWAEKGAYRVSIPKRIPEGEIESYAIPKLEEQAKIHSEIKAPKPPTAQVAAESRGMDYDMLRAMAESRRETKPGIDMLSPTGSVAGQAKSYTLGPAKENTSLVSRIPWSEPITHDVLINGEKVGVAQFIKVGDKAEVTWLGKEGDYKASSPKDPGPLTGMFGPRGLNELKQQFQVLHPEIKTIEGVRVGGAEPGRIMTIDLGGPAKKAAKEAPTVDAARSAKTFGNAEPDPDLEPDLYLPYDTGTAAKGKQEPFIPRVAEERFTPEQIAKWESLREHLPPTRIPEGDRAQAWVNKFAELDGGGREAASQAYSEVAGGQELRIFQDTLREYSSLPIDKISQLAEAVGITKIFKANLASPNVAGLYVGSAWTERIASERFNAIKKMWSDVPSGLSKDLNLSIAPMEAREAGLFNAASAMSDELRPGRAFGISNEKYEEMVGEFVHDKKPEYAFIRPGAPKSVYVHEIMHKTVEEFLKTNPPSGAIPMSLVDSLMEQLTPEARQTLQSHATKDWITRPHEFITETMTQYFTGGLAAKAPLREFAELVLRESKNPEVQKLVGFSLATVLAAKSAEMMASGKEKEIEIPQYQEGGMVPATGPALLHEGEYVVPSGGALVATPSVAPAPISIDDFAKAIARQEGFGKPGVAPTRNNNPGDLMDASKTLRHFDTVAEGWAALAKYIQDMVSGVNKNYPAGSTLAQAGMTYSNNDPNWAKNVAGFLGVKQSTPLSEIIGQAPTRTPTTQVAGSPLPDVSKPTDYSSAFADFAARRYANKVDLNARLYAADTNYEKQIIAARLTTSLAEINAEKQVSDEAMKSAEVRAKVKFQEAESPKAVAAATAQLMAAQTAASDNELENIQKQAQAKVDAHNREIALQAGPGELGPLPVPTLPKLGMLDNKAFTESISALKETDRALYNELIAANAQVRTLMMRAGDQQAQTAVDSWKKIERLTLEEIQQSTSLFKKGIEDQAREIEESRAEAMGAHEGVFRQVIGMEQAAQDVPKFQSMIADVKAQITDLQAAQAGAYLNATALGLDPTKDTQKYEQEIANLNLLIDQLRAKLDQAKLQAKDWGQQLTSSLESAANTGFNNFNQGFIRMITGGQSFARTMQNAWSAMAESFIVSCLRMAEAWAIKEAKQLIMSALGMSEQKAGVATQIAANRALVMSEAAVAGASGTASFAAAPWPIDMGAPAFGAAMYSTAASFVVAEQGGLVPGAEGSATPAMLHGQELVLPADLSKFVQTAAANQGGMGKDAESYGARGTTVIQAAAAPSAAAATGPTTTQAMAAVSKPDDQTQTGKPGVLSTNERGGMPGWEAFMIGSLLGYLINKEVNKKPGDEFRPGTFAVGPGSTGPSINAPPGATGSAPGSAPATGTAGSSMQQQQVVPTEVLSKNMAQLSSHMAAHRPAFEKGGVVPANLHEGEMVLPKNLSTFVQTAAAGSAGKTAGTPAATPNARDINFHYSPNFSALDSSGMRDVMAAHGEEMFRYFTGKARKMGITI